MQFRSRSVNASWGPGMVDTNWELRPVDTNWHPGPVNTNWDTGQGARKYKDPLRC